MAWRPSSGIWSNDMTTQIQRVRLMTADDLEQVLAWRNHDDVRRHMFTQHEISLAEHTRWFERAAQDSSRQLLIFEIGTRPLGFVNLHRIAPGGIADWGFYIAPDAPKGTGQALGHTALQHAFTQPGLHKLCAQVLTANERSIQFHQRLGFRQEGILRQQHYDGRNYHDVVCFGLLAAEWQTNP
jgi:UDP-4-amino-4,6-dideoxy-N-acetyl-beta-L-altrosamine N-acetyltransferase